MQAADPEQGQGIPDVQPMGVLLFGDSVDFRFLKFFCEFALEQEPKPFTVSESDWLKLQGERHPNVSSVCCSILTAFISGRTDLARICQEEKHGPSHALLHSG